MDLTDSADPLEARAARLLRQGRPPEASEAIDRARRHRVRAALRQRAGRPRAPLLLRPAFTAALLLLLGSAALAAALLLRRPAPRPPAPAVPTVFIAPPVAAPPAVTRASPVLPASSPALRTPSRPPLRPPIAAPSVAASSPPPAPGAVPGRAESALLLSAVLRALRRDRDPERAGILAADYLRLHPEGALAEEALGLGIEAAARGDREAARLGAEYLRRFPGGRFREIAERALRRPLAGAPEQSDD